MNTDGPKKRGEKYSREMIRADQIKALTNSRAHVGGFRS